MKKKILSCDEQMKFYTILDKLFDLDYSQKDAFEVATLAIERKLILGGEANA
jgi:hypothetical protein